MPPPSIALTVTPIKKAALEVSDGKHNDAVFLDKIHETVRKTFHPAGAVLVRNQWPSLWKLLDQRYRIRHFPQKFLPKSRPHFS